ncbi:hypothetical protein SAMN02745177_02310 [Desulforamulus hydrothermalis Lam5 = DSM 18033]|nr:hypothetical protein SAMN02745177_02310 [Desulforamulus hydrothermalis Lam5 = DSM 18033]
MTCTVFYPNLLTKNKNRKRNSEIFVELLSYNVEFFNDSVGLTTIPHFKE